MKRTTLLGWLAVLFLVAMPGEAQTTVSVDCSKNQSINEALEKEKKAESLIVEIEGMCRENVVVERDFVTLRGVDPAVDGVEALTDSDITVLIDGARDVNVENLRLAEGLYGLWVEQSAFTTTLVNCRIEDNSFVGAIVRNSNVRMDDGSLSFNSGFGLVVQMGSRFVCDGCTIEDNFGGGFSENVDVSGGSLAVLVESDVSGSDVGIFLSNSNARLRSSTVSANVTALEAFSSTVGLRDVTVEGAINLTGGAEVDLSNNSLQNSNPGVNTVSENALLSIRSSSQLTGTLDLSNFGRASFFAGSIIVGSLTCGSGGDAWCADSSTSISGTSNCGQCLKP